MDTTKPIGAVPSGSVAVPCLACEAGYAGRASTAIHSCVMPAAVIYLHTTDLPCPACSWGVEHKKLDDLDFCDGHSGCGHYHVEADCPIARVA